MIGASPSAAKARSKHFSLSQLHATSFLFRLERLATEQWHACPASKKQERVTVLGEKQHDSDVTTTHREGVRTSLPVYCRQAKPLTSWYTEKEVPPNVGSLRTFFLIATTTGNAKFSVECNGLTAGTASAQKQYHGRPLQCDVPARTKERRGGNGGVFAPRSTARSGVTGASVTPNRDTEQQREHPRRGTASSHSSKRLQQESR